MIIKKRWIPFILFTVGVILLVSIIAIQNGSINDYKNQIADINNRLTNAENGLYDANLALNNTGLQLSLKENELDFTQDQLDTTKSQVGILQGQLDSKQNDLISTEQQLAVSQTRSSSLEKQLSGVQEHLDKVMVDYENVTTGYAYVLNDPTFAEMQSFLMSDNTDLITYDLDNYTCYNFTADVILHASKQNIRCAFIYVKFPDSAHAIIAFNTTDKGMVYIEPQSDEEVNLRVGGHYWQEIISVIGYLTPLYDDTVEEFDVIW